MLNNNSINTSSFKAVGVRKGGLKIDKNDLSPVVLKIQAFECLIMMMIRAMMLNNNSFNRSSFKPVVYSKEGGG